MTNQQKLIEMQLLEQDIQQIQKNIQTIEQQMLDIELIKKNLDDFSKLKKDSESLMAVANGIFARAKILDTKELLVNVGSNTVVKKTIPETKTLLDEQTKELNKYREQLMQQLNETIFKIEELQHSLKEIKE